MPKDEFDPEDPMELVGVGMFTDEDTTESMADCFIEEFMRLGYNHKQLLALFRNPYYVGMNMVLQNKGEKYVRDRISEVFATWGRAFEWPAHFQSTAVSPPVQQTANIQQDRLNCATDPMGEPLPDIKL
jgi:hypothetical protein